MIKTYVLERVNYYDDGIMGRLFDENGIQIAFTLEHAYDSGSNLGYIAKVPLGQYVCQRGYHVLLSGPIEAFEVLNVPNHTGILFHIGNSNADSEGCILLGKRCGTLPDVVLDSRIAFNQFMHGLEGTDVFNLIVRNSNETTRARFT